MAFQKPLPEWKQPGIRPPESKIKEGYQVLDKPPAAWLNWQMNTTYEALQELQEKAAEKEDVSEALGEAKAYTDEKTKNLEAPVKSVNSKTGDVVLTPEDIGAVPKIGNPTISGNLSVTQRVQSAFLQAESAGGLAGIFAANGTVSAPKDVYVEFKTRGVNGPRSGYIGLPNPAAPDDIVLHSDNGGISLHAPNKKVLINGIDVVGELNQVKQSGVDARSKIADAVNAKGVPASANDTFDQLARKIDKIYTGRPVARVNTTTSYSKPTFYTSQTHSLWAYFVLVTGLGFRAKRITMHTSSSTFPTVVYDAERSHGKIWTEIVYYGSGSYLGKTESFLVTEADTLPDIGQNSYGSFTGTITPDGFLLPVATAEDYANKAVHIVAIG
ncbi:hypothetical protein L5D93_16405 [Paenibacillus thiaminolyticus]|nr:hypothetical protein [Paenibacillus thiaminolyticus]